MVKLLAFTKSLARFLTFFLKWHEDKKTIGLLQYKYGINLMAGIMECIMQRWSSSKLFFGNLHAGCVPSASPSLVLRGMLLDRSFSSFTASPFCYSLFLCFFFLSFPSCPRFCGMLNLEIWLSTQIWWWLMKWVWFIDWLINPIQTNFH